jgi:hypothetical protein
METQDAATQISRRLRRVLDNMSADIERVEMLSAALAGLSKPVPAYEPAFHHLHAVALRDHQIGIDPAAEERD